MAEPATDPLLRRSAAWQSLAAATPPGGLALPHCTACDHRFHPPQPFCPRCLQQPVSSVTTHGQGEVMSSVRLHRPLAAFFQARAPVAVVRVQLRDGPAVFALAEGDLQPGQAVQVLLHHGPPHAPASAEAAGVLVARPWPESPSHP